jgi:hypothetical protein
MVEFFGVTLHLVFFKFTKYMQEITTRQLADINGHRRHEIAAEIRKKFQELAASGAVLADKEVVRQILSPALENRVSPHLIGRFGMDEYSTIDIALGKRFVDARLTLTLGTRTLLVKLLVPISVDDDTDSFEVVDVVLE